MYEAFLKEYDLNEETMEKIIKECSKHYRSLRNFLMFSSWHSIPSYRLRTILDIYNKSSVNIKTGELIDISKDKASKQLKNLSIETFMVEDIPGVFAEKLINAYNNSQVNLKTGSVISPSEELSKIKVCINPPVFLVTINEEVEDEAIEDNYNIYITCKSSDGRLLCLQGTNVSGEFAHKAGINLRYKKDIKTPVLKRLMDENACVSLNTFMIHPEVDIVELTLTKKHYKKFKNFTVSCQRNGKNLQSKSIRDKMNTQISTTIFRLKFKDNKWEYELCPDI